MEVRITFRSEIYIEGDNLGEIKDKWEEIPLYSPEAEKSDVDFIEVLTVEDADDYSDLMSKWIKE